MNKKATVKAVCISRAKGTPKEPVPHIDLIEDYGIEGDAHAGKWHRQGLPTAHAPEAMSPERK